MNKIFNLKSLKTQLKKLEHESQVLKIELGNLQKTYQLKRTQQKQLKAKLEELQKQEISVSDHAIVRYLERIKGMDIEKITQDILSPEVLSLIEKLGDNGSYPNQDFQVVLKNRVVITVLRK